MDFIFSCLVSCCGIPSHSFETEVYNSKLQAFVMFPQESSDEEEHLPQRHINRHSTDVPIVLRPEEVTEEDIRNVAQKSGGKTYSSEHGTCCHQCR